MHRSDLQRVSCFLLALAALFCSARLATAEDRSVSLSDGKTAVTPPESWEAKKPASRVIDYEFAIAPAGDDETPGRATISGPAARSMPTSNAGSGNSFSPTARSTKKAAKVEDKKIAGQEVHLVDISGTSKISPGGPFAGGPIIERKGYRMFAAIIVTKDLGNYYLKFYGPERTVADNQAAFDKMVESLEVK